jgi:hypothetical protein
MPPYFEAMPAYWFAQLRCCLTGVDRTIDGEEFDREEYCNRVGYPIMSCPPDYTKGPSVCPKVCGEGCLDCQSYCDSSSSDDFRGARDMNDMWCCNAEENGPPVWWLSLRPNGNANQFCTEVGNDIGSCR